MQRFEVAADPGRDAYFHNVRVNDEAGSLTQEIDPEQVFDVLDANCGRLRIDPLARSHRERIRLELTSSAGRVAELTQEQQHVEQQVDATLYDVCGFTAAQRERIDAEYD